MNINIENVILIYAAIVNVFLFLLMGFDKFRAIHMSYRIPESVLFLFAVIGGSIGGILGMYVFRHKTKHLQFVIGFPAILLIQLGIMVYIKFFSPFEFLIR